MDSLGLNFSTKVSCAICGRCKLQDDTWFVVSENCWEDRLDVCRWDLALALSSGNQSLCGPKHVRELVVHWMTTGCLHYPFAAGSRPPNPLSAGHPAVKPALASSVLGRIRVDRESIRRILRDNPMSLSPVLEELVAVLEGELGQSAEPQPEYFYTTPSGPEG